MKEKELIERLVGEEYEIEGGYTINEIYSNGYNQLKSLKSNGVYFVVGKIKDLKEISKNVVDGATTEIKKKNKKGETKTIVKILEVSELKSKLEELEKSSLENGEDFIILYIGSATRNNNNGLYERIKEYIRWGCCKGQNHAGGRAIWQIPECKELLKFYWIRLDTKEASKNMEANLIKKYEKKYLNIPFANMKREKVR